MDARPLWRRSPLWPGAAWLIRSKEQSQNNEEALPCVRGKCPRAKAAHQALARRSVDKCVCRASGCLNGGLLAV